jgi:hypothetical protein
MRRDKVVILQHVLEECADLLPACRARVGLENPVTFGGELLECVGHFYTSSLRSVLLITASVTRAAKCLDHRCRR